MEPTNEIDTIGALAQELLSEAVEGYTRKRVIETAHQAVAQHQLAKPGDVLEAVTAYFRRADELCREWQQRELPRVMDSLARKLADSALAYGQQRAEERDPVKMHFALRRAGYSPREADEVIPMLEPDENIDIIEPTKIVTSQRTIQRSAIPELSRPVGFNAERWADLFPSPRDYENPTPHE